jgi:hypothetical protein
MSHEDIARTARQARKARRLGVDPACTCGWTDLDALHRTDEGVTCYECSCAKRGHAIMEAHHVFGKAVDPTTINVMGNAHRSLSESQRTWTEQIRQNTVRDPLLWLAGAALSLLDHLTLWVRGLAAVAAWLVSVAEALRERYGEQWWVELGVGTPWKAMAV